METIIYIFPQVALGNVWKKNEWREEKKTHRKYKVKVQHPIKRQKHMEEGFSENCTL